MTTMMTNMEPDTESDEILDWELELINVNASTVPPIPSSITQLHIVNVKECNLLHIPETVKRVYISGTTEPWPVIPNTVTSLTIKDMSMVELPPLPSTLKQLTLIDVPITQLPPLPSSLELLALTRVPILQIHTLPSTLNHFQIYHSPVQILPPMRSMFNNKRNMSIVMHDCPNLLFPYEEHCYYSSDRYRYCAQYAILWEKWWVKKRHEERCAAIKEELMATTWHPKRVLTWCVDEEERHEWAMNP